MLAPPNDMFWFVGICSRVILPVVFFMSRSTTTGVVVAHEARNGCGNGLSDDTTKPLERQAAPGRLIQWAGRYLAAERSTGGETYQQILAPDVQTCGETTPRQQIVCEVEVTTSGFW